MAANLPMAGNGHLMMQQPQQASQQPASQRQQHIQALVYQHLANSQHSAPPGGWQSQVTLQDRLVKTMNLISNTVLALPTADFQKAVSFGLDAEKKAFQQSHDKGMYDSLMSQKVNEMVKRRQANAPNLQNQLNADAARQQAQAQLQAQQQAQQQAHQQAQQQQQHMLNQMAAARGLGQPAQHGFQHLQHPMQVSPIPQGQGQGMGGAMGPVGMMQNRPGQRPFAMPMTQQRAPGAVTPQELSGGGLRSMDQLNPMERQKVLDVAQTLYNRAEEDSKISARALISERMPAMFADYQSQGKDPAILVYQNQALAILQRQQQHQARLMHQRQQMAANVMQHPQQPGQMNGPMGNLLGPQGGAPDGQMFQPNLETIRDQQHMGIVAQQKGQLVVPANTAPGRNPAQSPMNGLPVQAPPTNPQMLGQMQRTPQGFMPVGPGGAANQARMHGVNIMQGQPGGLSGPPPNAQSPAMNTLTAPMRQPPVPMNPVTGQPMPQNNQPGAATLNPTFNHQNNPRPMQNPAVAHALANMTAEARASLNNLPPGNVPQPGGMDKWSAPGRPINNAMAGPKAQPPMTGVPNPMFAPGQSPVGPLGNANQFSMANNLTQQPGVVNTPGGQAASNQATIAFNAWSSLPKSKVMMDSLDVPPSVLHHMRGSIPADIRKWSQLKQYAQQTNMAALMQNQLYQFQLAQMKQIFEKRTQQQQQQQQQQRQQAPPQESPQAPNATPNAPGVPVPTPRPVPPLPPHVIVPQTTPQELEQVRKNQPRFANLPDADLIPIIQKLKEDQFTKKYWQQQQYLQQQQQRQQEQQQQQLLLDAQKNNAGLTEHKPVGQNFLVQTPQQPPAPVPTPTSAPQNGRQPGPSKAQLAASEAETSAPGPAAPKQARQPQPARPNASPAAGIKQQGVKRPRPEESDGDAASQPVNGASRPSAQPAAARPAQEQMVNLASEQKGGMPKPAGNDQSIMQELKRMLQEESRQQMMMSKQEHPIPMRPDEVANMTKRLVATVKTVQAFLSKLARWYAVVKDQEKARYIFRARARLASQFEDQEMTKPKGVFTMLPRDLDQIDASLATFYKDFQMLSQQRARQPGSEPTEQPKAQEAQPAVPNVQGLAQPPKATQQNRPPAAPTSTHAPALFGTQQTPIVAPTYFNSPELTRGNLKAPPPPRKKAKKEETASPSVTQAAGPSASPQTRIPSPEVKRQPAPTPTAPVPEAPKSFTCPESDCEWHTAGFPTEEAFQTHYQEEHVKPREDPFKYMNDSIMAMYGLDSDTVLTTTGQGQAQPGKPDGGATPMSRDGSMRRQGSAAGGKSIEGAGTPGKGEVAKPATGLSDFDVSRGVVEDPWAGSTINPASLFANFDPVGDNVLIDLNVYRSSTPNDTPDSGKDSGASEPNSDISEGAGLDIGIDFQPLLDADMLLDLNSFSMDAVDGDMLGDSLQFAMDDFMADASKPFQLDPVLYSMDVS
ncbi:hypothetical protein QBC47DRAFT_93459 [Echria macrotheca]|uniref:Mediator complex subunit 15 KIX domain-containing protein n=1 Tax=Echria macrotheca TaxID=438768 RepID=A0AAJ0F124_9PEZI|nr:hypothetical protein QBC47DRAFT_93459 [Echria macrotheca]